MNFFNNDHGVLYFLSIGLLGILGVCIVFAFKIFVIYVVARLIFRFMLKFLSEVENRNLKNFTRKENKEE